MVSMPSSAVQAPAASIPPRTAQAPVATPATADLSRQALATWQGGLAAHLARFEQFPEQAQRRGEQGVVLMRVAVSRNGQVSSMSMARGSGYADLDAQAQAWIERAEPLPPFPPEITAQQMVLMIPLRFTLR
ncbi:energy transducer TonB [Pararobbsia alpina]|nr:TonB family protein [Pararobbsia alpina]